MNRYLAIGYLLTTITFFASLMVLRGAVSIFEGVTAFLVGELVLLALIPAAVLLFVGSRRSVGRLRKFIGYSLFAFTALASVSACVAIALIVFGQTHGVAA